jgi:hypothetical protein
MKMTWGKTFNLGIVKFRIGDRPWLKLFGLITFKPSARRSRRSR